MNLEHKPIKMESKRSWLERMQVIVPNEREWKTILTTINAASDYIPNFYIFKSKKRKRNYISKCDNGALWAMQRSWMDLTFSLNSWTNLLNYCIKGKSSILQENT